MALEELHRLKSALLVSQIKQSMAGDVHELYDAELAQKRSELVAYAGLLPGISIDLEKRMLKEFPRPKK